jgi:hypothetical protein
LRSDEEDIGATFDAPPPRLTPGRANIGHIP